MKRPLLWVALAYIATLGVVSLFWREYFKIGFCLLAIMAIVGAFYRRKPMAYMLLGAILGLMVIIPHYANHLDIQARLGQTAKLNLSIEETRFYGDHFGYYTGAGELEFSDGKHYKGTITLTANEAYLAQEGESITAEVSIAKVKGFWESAGSDKLVVKQQGEITVIDTSKRPLRDYFVKLNRQLTQQTYKIMPAHRAAIINAIVLGEGRGIDQDTRNALNTAALSHIIVVSGQHLVIAASIITILIKDKRKPWAVVLSLACGWGFAALTGFSPSMLRGAVMFTTTQAGLLFGKRSDSISALCLATILMTAYDPSILLSVSFILSASAVMGISIVGKLITKGGIQAYKKLFESISEKSVKRISVMGTILGAQFGVLPGLVYLSGGIPAYGLISNLLVLPILLPVMLTGAATVFLANFLPDIAGVLAILSGGLVEILLRIAHLCATLPGALISFTQSYQLLWLLIAIAFALSTLLYDYSKFVVRAVSVGLLMALVLGGAVYRIHNTNTYELYSFDKMNTVIYTKDQVAVVIGVPTSDDLRQVTNLLTWAGVNKVSYLVDTSDHSDGQTIALLAKDFAVDTIVCKPNPTTINTAGILGMKIIDSFTFKKVALQDLEVKIDYYTDDINTPQSYIDRNVIADIRCKATKLYSAGDGVNRYKLKIGDDNDLR